MPPSNVLPLDSPRWKSLATFFGTPGQVPRRLARWRKSVGTADEAARWTEVSEQVLHQDTITNAAYAVVPYAAQELERVTPARRLDYLADIALVESLRQQRGAPVLAKDLAGAYHDAVAQAKQSAVASLGLKWKKIDFRHLLSAVASLHGHGVLGGLLFNLDRLCGECPKCGECVYPEEIQDSGYIAT